MNLKILALMAFGVLCACKKESYRSNTDQQENPTESDSSKSLRRTSSNSGDRQLALARKKEAERMDEIETAIRRDWHLHPAQTLEWVNQRQYTEFSSADKNTQERMIHMARFAGELSGTPVAERFDCMFRILPLSVAPIVVDDSIRILNKTEVYDASTWLMKLEPCEERTGLLRLIFQRMKILEMPPSEIHDWAQSIPDETERSKMLSYLKSSGLDWK